METIIKVTQRAENLADQILRAYYEHDLGNLEAAASNLAQVYEALFPDVPVESCQQGAHAYFAALAIKDSIDEEADRSKRLTDPRWSAVYEHFLTTAHALGLDPRWAYHHYQGFQKHKGELEYWQDLMAAERFFLARVLRDDHWQYKRSDGRNGPGPLPFLYMVSAECHDLHSRKAAALSRSIMAIYFTLVLGDDAENQPCEQCNT